MTAKRTEQSSKRRTRHRGRRITTALIVLVAAIVFGYLVIAVPLKLTLGLFAGVVGLLLTIYRPHWALYLLFASVILLTDAVKTPGSGAFFALPNPDLIEGLPSASDTFLLMLVGITTLRSFLLERTPLPLSLKPLFLVCCILIVAALTGLHRGCSTELIRIDFMNMLFPVLCFYLCVTLLNSRQRINELLAVLFTAAGLKAVILSGYYLAGRGWLYRLDSAAAYRVATMDSADLLVFITLALIALHLLMQQRLSILQSVGVCMATLPMLFVIIFSYRRAQWIGLLLSLALLYLGTTKQIRKRLAVFMLAGVLAGAAAVTVSGFSEEKIGRISSRLSSVFDPEQSSNIYHILEAQQTLHDIMQTPLFGLGLGSHHTPLGLYDEDLVPTNVVHNTFLYIWMKTGLAGLLFLLACGGVFVTRILSFRKAHLLDADWALLLPLGASLGLWLAMFLTGPVPWYFHQTYLLALFAAMGVCLMRQSSSAEEQS